MINHEEPREAPWRVAALYKFTPVDDPTGLRDELAAHCTRLDIAGTLLVAREGINGTVAGQGEAIAKLIEAMQADPVIGVLDVKYSQAPTRPFNRMKVRVKAEIVTLGVDGIDAAHDAGQHVAPADWNALIAREDVVTIDTRNAYEVELGTFAGAVDPKTDSFTQLPDWVDETLDLPRDTPVAMFCTGGIRCEKSTALLKVRGFSEVYHLDGGILRYLEEVPAEESLWRGECFVFDDRVSVRHGLEPGDNTLCHACRMPVTPQERQRESYEEGVSCPRCHGTHDEARLAGLRERQRQVVLASARGEQHVAHDVETAKANKRAAQEAQRAASRAGRKGS